jgi:hypothetical protein
VDLFCILACITKVARLGRDERGGRKKKVYATSLLNNPELPQMTSIVPGIDPNTVVASRLDNDCLLFCTRVPHFRVVLSHFYIFSFLPEHWGGPEGCSVEFGTSQAVTVFEDLGEIASYLCSRERSGNNYLRVRKVLVNFILRYLHK